MATPNSEQLKAIEHSGGVLLKAGAGSGKTFVLKEHLLYLAGKWIQEFKSENPNVDEFDIFIRQKLRRIIMMTFTKKAAGELAIRLETEFFDKLENSSEEDYEYWEKTLDNLSYLTVSTIHGFCLKIIKMGFFPGVSADQSVITEGEFRDCISKLFDEYVENDDIDKDFSDLFYKNKSGILNSILGIFSDPTLRKSWIELAAGKGKDISLDTVVEEVYSSLNINIFDQYFDPEDYNEYNHLKWFQFLERFCDFKRGMGKSYKELLKLYEYFNELDFKIPSKPSDGKAPDEVIDYYIGIRDLKDFLKKSGEDFYLYSTLSSSHVEPWFNEILKLVTFINNRYEQEDGITFSDLEYIVHKGLENTEVCDLIHQEFDYFIIDEFQDTSFIQFEIVSRILKNNFNKLFCVGDLKQAIYGFRGGELGVFLECEKKIPQNLSLKNNYRSDADVINFNNQFFDFLFKKGKNYLGVDKHSVPVEYQAVPDSKNENGEIYKLNLDLSFIDEETKLSNSDLNYCEALGLLAQIEKNIGSGDTAVLYRRLGPSLILIKLLMQRNIGFTAQLKIPFLEDPIVGVFKTLLEGYFNRNELGDVFQEKLIRSYLEILYGKSIDRKIDERIKLFYKHVISFGLYESFCLFAEDIGIANSNFKNNFEMIKSFISLTGSDKTELLKLINKQSEISYSLDFQYGDNADQVKIMTAHASKGLQFSHVLLGGIYTNDSHMPSQSLIGKFPKSFKWSQSIHGKKRFKTPYLFLEEIAEKNKEFSESKRLFYVANTRAENTLGWVNIDLGTVKRSKPVLGAWIYGIRRWEEESNDFDNITNYDLKIEDSFDELFLENLQMSPPLFHVDSLGIVEKKTLNERTYLPELSVTKLTSLIQCPKKFYLQNICKLSEEDLKLLDITETFEEAENFEIEELNSNNVLKSSAERGTLLHEKVSQIIMNDFVFDKETIEKSVRKSILWTVDKLKEIRDNYIFISEKQIKFELLGYMISGIPDLILQPMDLLGEYEIWDFKTGKISEEKLEPYFMQLMAYAYAQYILGHNSKDKPTKLVLCFSDENELVERIVSFENVEKYLMEKLSLTKDPTVVNTNYCEYCPYDLICQK